MFLFLFFLFLGKRGLARLGSGDGGSVPLAGDGLLGGRPLLGHLLRDLVEGHLQGQGVVEPLFRILFEQLADQFADRLRTIGSGRCNVGRFFFEVGEEHFGCRRRGERGLAREHLEHHAAQGIQIGLARDRRLSRDLLGAMYA